MGNAPQRNVLKAREMPADRLLEAMAKIITRTAGRGGGFPPPGRF
ncbi:hypothetical protein SAMN04487972_10366 [Paracoccus halophilus]|uniref:Uncharacterized protein n=1 Tax=Paracoccus halophilus TaxID=376733 RepID=A0A1I0SVX1_9RHOB|nr:hypothetical protein SAMN04487972_10366 [Paracoccus halophilus]